MACWESFLCRHCAFQQLVVDVAGITAAQIAGYADGGGGGVDTYEGAMPTGLHHAWGIVKNGDLRIWGSACDYANELCRKHWSVIERLAAELRDRAELTGNEVTGLWRLYAMSIAPPSRVCVIVL